MAQYANLQAVIARIQESMEFQGVPIKSIDQRGISGASPLAVAAVWEDREAAQHLLDAGADVNARCEGGYTPLHFAAEGDNVELLKLLCERGADKNIENEDGQNALSLAIIFENAAIIRELSS